MDLEDMVLGMVLTYAEIVDILYVKNIGGSTIGYTIPPGLYEVADDNLMLKSSHPYNVKVNITIDDIRLRLNLTTSKTIGFSIKSLLYKILGFVKAHSGPLGDIEVFVQLIPGKYKSEKRVNITGVG